MAKNLTINRGNTQNVALSINPITLQEGDTVYFTAKSKYDNDMSDDSAAIKKDVTYAVNGSSVEFTLSPQETNVEPGKYVYDITANLADNGRVTLVGGKLTVKPVVTLRGIN